MESLCSDIFFNKLSAVDKYDNIQTVNNRVTGLADIRICVYQIMFEA